MRAAAARTWPQRSESSGGAAEVALGLVIDGLATYRLVKLIRHDRITEPVREAVEEAHGPAEESNATYFLNCPWCLSFYFGTGLTLARHFWPGPTALFSRSFALSALTGIATQYLDD